MLARFASDREWTGDLEILIAGCGIGHQTSITFKAYGLDANITVIDISRRAVAHAVAGALETGAPIYGLPRRISCTLLRSTDALACRIISQIRWKDGVNSLICSPRTALCMAPSTGGGRFHRAQAHARLEDMRFGSGRVYGPFVIGSQQSDRRRSWQAAFHRRFLFR